MIWSIVLAILVTWTLLLALLMFGLLRTASQSDRMIDRLINHQLDSHEMVDVVVKEPVAATIEVVLTPVNCGITRERVSGASEIGTYSVIEKSGKPVVLPDYTYRRTLQCHFWLERQQRLNSLYRKPNNGVSLRRPSQG